MAPPPAEHGSNYFSPPSLPNAIPLPSSYLPEDHLTSFTLIYTARSPNLSPTFLPVLPLTQLSPSYLRHLFSPRTLTVTQCRSPPRALRVTSCRLNGASGSREEEKGWRKLTEKKWERDEEFHRLESKVGDSEEKGRSGEVGRIRFGAALAHGRACWELESCPSSSGSKLSYV